MNCPSKQFIKPVLLAGALGVGLMPAIGNATSNIGNQFNQDCPNADVLFDGGNCSLCHSGSPSGSNATIPDCPVTPTPTPTPPPVVTPTPTPTPPPVVTPTPIPTPPPVVTPEPTPTPPPEVCTDEDGDGFAAEGGPCGTMDCNDDNIDVNPNADENCTDGIDNNCNNLIDAQDQDAVNCPDAPVCTDGDGDGYAVEGGELCGPMDCDDRDADVNPGESENCGDGVDNDCDSSIDAVDTACQARNDDDDSDDDEEEENRRGDRDDNDSRDSRRSRRSSRD